MPPICKHCDSQFAIGRAQNSMYNGKYRHICRVYNHYTTTLYWKNGFEHNKLAIFKLKLQWVPQTLFGGST